MQPVGDGVALAVWAHAPATFVGAAFIHTCRAGALLILGLILNALLPIRLPWG